jgi:hypothetical protein
MRIACFSFLCCVFFAGCGPQRAYQPYDAQASSVSLVASEAVGGYAKDAEKLSLFKTDQDVLGNDDLVKILALKLTTPENARLVTVALGNSRYQWAWSPEVAKAEEQTTSAFLAKVGSSKRLASVQQVPSILMPVVQTIPRLRESAARLQADLMLIYVPSFRTYEKYRFWGRDETKAYCTVEAVLLDVRSGIVRKTSVATEDFEAKRADDDKNFDETIRKAENQVLERALLRVAADFVKFLEDAP